MSLAKCSVCSRYDRNINVICESRCLICGRCQGNPVIKKLFTDRAEDCQCPLCDAVMSRSMVSWCNSKDVAVASSSSMNINAMGLSRVTNDLDCMRNPLPTFLKKFSKIYGELGGVSDTYLTRAPSRGSRPPTSSIGGADELAFGADATKSNAFAAGTPDPKGALSPSPMNADSPQARAAPSTPSGVSLVAPTQPLFIDPDKVLPPKLSYTAIQETACDAFVLQWASMLKNGNESMTTMLLKACTRRKMSTRTNDYKVKGLLDFYHAGGPPVDSHLMLVMFGRVAGIIPRSKSTGYSDTVRKAWGPIATSILVLAHCERCWKMGGLRDGDDNPSVSEVKSKLHKLSSNKTLSLKKAIRLIVILMKSDQAHWSMSPCLPAVREYNIRIPWHADSVSRLLHLMFQVSKPHGYEHPVPSSAHGVRQSATAPQVPVTPKGFAATDILRDLKNKSRKLWKASPKPRRHVASENSSINVTEPNTPLVNNNMKEMDGFQVIDTPEVGMGTLHEASVLTGDGESVTGSVNGDAASVGETINTESTAGIAGAPGYVKREPFLPFLSKAKAQQVATELLPPRMGEILHSYESDVDGTFDLCDYETAMAEAEGRQITVAELAMVCVEAWECECNLMQYNLNRALVAGDRRSAIVGTYDTEAAIGTKHERRAILRVLKWYASVFRREIDWSEFRQLVEEKAFPFDIPLGLMEKTTAELHNLAIQVASDWEFQRAKEYAEDMADRAGMNIEDYAARIVNALGFKRMNNTTGGIDRKSSFAFNTGALVDESEEQSALYLGDNYADSADLSLTSDISKLKNTTEADGKHMVSIAHPHLRVPRDLNISEAEEWRKYRSPVLAPLQYASDEPVRHPLNMIDVLDNDPVLLEKLRILSYRPIGPTSSQALARTLDEDIRDIMKRVDESEEVASIDESLASLSVAEANHGAEPEEDAASQYIPSGTTSAAEAAKGIKDRRVDKSNEPSVSAAPSKRQRNVVAMKANARVLNKIHLREQKKKQKEMNVRLERIAGYEEKKKQEKEAEEAAKAQEEPNFADISYIDGAVAEAPITLESALAFEKSFKSILYKDKPMEKGVMSFICGGYMRPHQMNVLEHLDMSNADMGSNGAVLLAKAFRSRCRVTHLVLNGNNMSDSACGMILEGIHLGGGSQLLKYLDLRRNQLTMVTDGLKHLENIVSLTSLNLSWNCLTVDCARHADILRSGLRPLINLTYLNLARNRLQDNGMKVLQEVLENLISLKSLDIRHCFMTPLSYKAFDAIIRRCNAPLNVINLRGNIITDHDRLELLYQAKHHEIDCIIDEPKHATMIKKD